MAEKIYIYNSDQATCIQNLYNELQVLIEWGWIKSIDIVLDGGDDTSHITLRDLNDTEIIRLGMYQGYITFSCVTESTFGDSIHNQYSAFEYVYICSHGIYISTRHASSNNNGDYGGYIITRTNNGTVGLISLCNVTGNSSNISKTARIQNLCAFSPDDALEQRSMMNLVTPYIRTYNSFVALPATNPPGVLSYFPHLYYMFTTQFGYISNQATPPINFIQNGYRYLDIGWFALRDDPPPEPAEE